MRTGMPRTAAAMLVVLLVSVGAARAQSAGDVLTSAETRLACAPPAVASRVSGRAPRVIGDQSVEGKSLFGTGDLLLVNAGTGAGLAVGQRFFIRRPYVFSEKFRAEASHNIHTSGWLTIVSANDTAAIGHVDFACDGIQTGDFIEPFMAPIVPQAAAQPGALDFSDLGRVLYSDEERRAVGISSFMLIDRGTVKGVTVGQRFAIYRDFKQPGLPLTEVGEGIIVSASPDRSVLQVLASHGAVESGDYVVPRR
jgi:hypothetical protein